MNSSIGFLKSRCGAALVIACLFVPSLFASCQSTDSKSDGGTKPIGNVVMKDANNYKATSQLTIPHVQTAPGADADLKICWDSVSTDLLCHAVSPTTDIDNVSFLELLGLTEQQVQTTFGSGQSLNLNSVLKYGDHHVDHTTGETCASLSTFGLGNTAISPTLDYVASANKTYMLLFSKGTVTGTGARSMLFIEPTAGVSTMTVNGQQGCGILDFTADITSPAALSIPIAGPWVLDWSQVTLDGLGNAVVYQDIDSLMLGYYDGMTVAQVQARFLDLQVMATATYTLPIPNGGVKKYADLKDATTATGVPFPGFTPLSGVWAVALLCSTCQVPAPVALAILSPS
jgi:hypothetical protein